jgi:hypothetical protein
MDEEIIDMVGDFSQKVARLSEFVNRPPEELEAMSDQELQQVVVARALLDAMLGPISFCTDDMNEFVEEVKKKDREWLLDFIKEPN